MQSWRRNITGLYAISQIYYILGQLILSSSMDSRLGYKQQFVVYNIMICR
jgi:hypothetical protein